MNSFREKLCEFLEEHKNFANALFYTVLLSSLFFIGTPMCMIMINFCWLYCLIAAWAQQLKWPAYIIILSICLLMNLANYL